MNDSNAKQQIVEKIKSSSNILVTVSKNPSVDELSAALGLTVLLNKMNKHATAVFSGSIPPAITFLDPQKTFEDSVNSLRDFIIALDKEKADHLRYKVEGDVVKIFITPYRTTISGDDLEFSQGDYNVELVLGLGVKNQDNLDEALAAHGKILHDATVMTLSLGNEASELGSVDWHEQNASSLSEMLVGLSDLLKSDKKLVDEQIATAYLTGIVAATDRFSNDRTSSHVMTVAAQLMSVGANQQLIASKLEEAHEIGLGATQQASNQDGTTNLSEGESTKLNKKPKSEAAPEAAKPKKDDGSLVVSHEKEGNIEQVAQATVEENQREAARIAQEKLDAKNKETAAAQQSDAARQVEQKLASQLATLPSVGVAPSLSVADLQKDLADANAEVTEASEQTPSTALPSISGAVSNEAWQGTPQTPTMGGTLNATTEQAAEDSRRAVEDDRNRTILSHGGAGYVGDRGEATPSFQSPINAAAQIANEEPPAIDLFAQPSSFETQPTAYSQPIQPPTATLADIDKQNRAPHEEARAAVDAAFGAVPFTQAPPASEPQPAMSQGVQQPAGLPPLPDFSTLPPLPPAPDFTQPMGALPPEKLEDVLGTMPAVTPAPAQPADPGQFKIPGQS